jgi:hypothetical protein
MIPLLLFIALSIMLIPLFIYSFVDMQNRVYANIVAAFLCSLLAAYLAVVITVGIVQYDPSVIQNQTTLINSTCLRYETQGTDCAEWLNTTYISPVCSSCPGVPIVDPSAGFMFVLISIIMTIYGMYMLYEAFIEHRENKENAP